MPDLIPRYMSLICNMYNLLANLPTTMNYCDPKVILTEYNCLLLYFPSSAVAKTAYCDNKLI